MSTPSLFLVVFCSLSYLACSSPVTGYTPVLGANLLCGPNQGPFPSVEDCLHIAERLIPQDVEGFGPTNLPRWGSGPSDEIYTVPQHIDYNSCRIEIGFFRGSGAALALWSQIPPEIELLARFCWGRVMPTLRDFRGGTFIFGRMGQLKMKVYRNPDSIFGYSVNSTVTEIPTS